MILANYIDELLYRYDCVIIPNFGGFITNKKGAKVNVSTHTFEPPTKQITFNSYLKHNDGLLANYIASAENISFEKANSMITASVVEWQTKLQTSSIEIASVGSLSLNEEKQLVFEPNTSTNFLTEAFGLTPVKSSLVERFKQEVKPLIVNAIEPEKEEVQEEVKKGIPAFVKYAASAAILLTLGVTAYKAINQKQQQEIFAKQQEELEQKIQEATFVIDNPLPVINLNVTKSSIGEFHIIAGAFQFEENAKKKVKTLKEQGFDAKILGKNKWGLIQVSYASFADEQEARNLLKKVKRTNSRDAWLYIKKIN